MCRIEADEIQVEVYNQLMADVEALHKKSDEFRVLIVEKIISLADEKKNYDSLFYDYLKAFCPERLDVFFAYFVCIMISFIVRWQKSTESKDA